MKRCYEWLKDDGRFCINIPLDKNKGGQQSVGADLTTLAKQIGFQYHATIVWNEGEYLASDGVGVVEECLCTVCDCPRRADCGAV